MLDHDTMAQLRQLKQSIHASKDRGQGVVKGSQGRFGFITLDDGREIYLSPEQMQRVFPDDRVAIEVVTNSEGKVFAQLERLLDSPLRTFTGRYIVHNNAHFVEPDLPRTSRWIFVPPKLRHGSRSGNPSRAGNQANRGGQPKHGDYVRARITQHPFKDGKAQVRIETVIGGEQQKGIEARYALARFGLPDSAPALIESDLEQPDLQARRDLTALPLITIDGADTRDMDDALYAESWRADSETAPSPAAGAEPSDTPSTGWKLTVAIADPSAWIKADSTLEKAIAARASSIYLPGVSVPMLPERLANDLCSLQPDAERLALVCEMWIDAAGTIARYAFSEARVCSHAKLSYEQAAEFLRTASPDNATAHTSGAWADSLRALQAATATLLERRQRDHIVLPERGEYRAQLDDNGRVASYLRQSKSAAHLLVEECMIAANRCAAQFLQPDGVREDSAVFVAHRGFRKERRDNVKKLLTAELPELVSCDTAMLADYIKLMHGLATTRNQLPLREILSRSLERGYFSASATPHFGMGLPYYTTITSPIRKFNDYLSQRAIKAKLHGATSATISAETIAQLQDCTDRIRQANNFAQQWLDCDYLLRQTEALRQAEALQQAGESQPAAPSKQDGKRIWRGTLVHVTSSGLVVRLIDSGIQGFIDTRHCGEKFSFDPVYMRLRSATRTFELEQEVDVEVAAIDMKKHQIAFQLADQSSTTM